MDILVVPSFYPTRERPTLGLFVRDHARLVGKSGHTVTVASLESRSIRGLGVKALTESHFQVEASSWPTHREVACRGWNPVSQSPIGAALWMFMAGRFAARQIPSRSTPLVISHNAVLAGASVKRTRRLRTLPHIITEHSSGILSGAIPAWQTRLAADAYRKADAVLAVSRALARRIHAIAPSQPRVQVIPNPIDTKFFHRGADPLPKPTRFGTIANLVPIKRIDIAIRAVSVLARKGLKVQYVIGGSGPEESHLRRLAAELGVEEMVSFTGPLDRPQVRSVLAQIATLCITSEYETFGMIAAEAMSMGLFVISSRCGGPTDFLSDDNGMVLPSCDPDCLASAMEARMNDQVSHDPDRTRRHIESICSEDAVAAAVSRVLDATLANRST